MKGFSSLVGVDFVPELIEVARKKNSELGSKIQFEVGNVVDLHLGNESFSQVLALGVILSHLPKRELRLQGLKEIFRILKPGGILLMNTHNIHRHRRLYFIRSIMRLVRFGGLCNPYGYGTGDIPRLGAKSGKPDLFFWRPGKSTLHYYQPAELVYDLLHVGFRVVEMNKSAVTPGTGDDFFMFRNEYLTVAAEKV